MIPEIGHFSLWLALGMALVLGAIPLVGAQTGRDRLITFDIGGTSADIGIIDYSRKETDQFGVTSVVERAWAKRMTARVVMDTEQIDDIYRTLAQLRATPVLWIGSEGFESLSVYGFYKEFSIDLAYPTVSYCSLTIEGLT
jgi:hypothetical protein